MFLFHTVPYVRRKDGFTTADQYGAWVAHQDLIRAALQHTSIEGIHFYLPFKGYAKDEIPALEELQQDFPHHEIEVKQTIELHKLARQYRYVTADDFEAFTPVALFRHADQECLFPLATIVHSIPHNLALIGYSNVLLLAEAFDVVVATSEAGRRAVSAIFEDVSEFVASRFNATPKKIKIVKIPLAVDEEFLRPRDSTAARLDLGLPLDSQIILHVGRLSEEFKADLEPLFNAFRRLSLENSTSHLVIAGYDARNKYGDSLRSLAAQFGIEDRVIIKANFPYPQKPLLYSASDIFVSPVDNIQETFGLSILEAMAAGLPVVGSDWSGYRDLVVHEETGFLVRTIWNGDSSRKAEVVASLRTPIKTGHYLAQQTVVDGEELYRYLKLLIDNEQLRDQFGKKGRELVVSRFSWQVVIKQYEGLWREQWRQLDHIHRKSEFRLPLNYDRQFGPFATMFLQGEMVLKTSVHRSSPSEIEKATLAHPTKSLEMQRVISECSLRPQSVKELLESGNETTLNVVTWLWKKGYLESA